MPSLAVRNGAHSDPATIARPPARLSRPAVATIRTDATPSEAITSGRTGARNHSCIDATRTLAAHSHGRGFAPPAGSDGSEGSPLAGLAGTMSVESQSSAAPAANDTFIPNW